ncbi:MAG: hypothetical protein IKQ92_09630 [Clostridia bacterium]|nr:hypothetical protein [Clostridia bacterium]
MINFFRRFYYSTRSIVCKVKSQLGAVKSAACAAGEIFGSAECEMKFARFREAKISRTAGAFHVPQAHFTCESGAGFVIKV